MKKLLISTFFALAVLVACNSPPATYTFQVTRIVEITVTVISEVEVTRPVEITRLVEVATVVTRETEVEVTRVVDNIVTATPWPSRTPTSTRMPPTSASSAPVLADQQAVDVGSELLATMKSVRNDMQSYGFQVDTGVGQGYLVCGPIIERHDRVAAAPAFDITGSSTAVQNAYNNYQDALSIFLQGVVSLTSNCRNFVLTPTPAVLNPPRGSRGACIGPGPDQAPGCRGFIPDFQWSTARSKVIEADAILAIAISNLDPLYGVSE